jgi:hypothetical protein
MMRSATRWSSAAISVTLLACVAPATVMADRWEVRREVREGYYEVDREKREAARELRRCQTRECARREVREGYREVGREKREARHEIRRELREDHERRYYRKRGKDDNDFLKGAVVGAAVVGIGVAIAKSNDD